MTAARSVGEARLARPPDPKREAPRPGGSGRGAGAVWVKCSGKEQGTKYLNPAAVAKSFPASGRHLSVYDGQTLIGVVVDIDGRHEAHAFDSEDRPLGCFPSRKLAFAVVSARFRHARDGAGR